MLALQLLKPKQLALFLDLRRSASAVSLQRLALLADLLCLPSLVLQR
jgi:hypothetical protein